MAIFRIVAVDETKTNWIKKYGIVLSVTIIALAVCWYFFSDFGVYFKAICSHWVILMSGIASVLITFHDKVRKSALGTYGLYSIALMCVFLAGFQAWQDQRQMYLASQTKLDSTHLAGEIYTFLSGTVVETGNTEMFIQIAIKNTGTPTIVQGYRLSVTGAGVNLTDISPTTIPETLRIHKEDGSVWLFYGRDAIYEKTVRPIPEGGMEVGWLRYNLGSLRLSRSEREEMKWTVSFYDIRGKQYSVTNSPKGGPPRYYPGSTTPLMPEVKPQ
jgi:hypothetical protein